MCGVVGYNITGGNALDWALSSLQNLEYRGYDSAGISYIKGTKIITQKSVGRVSNLHALCPQNEQTNVAIAHTRWATHGGATVVNAHPHHINNISLIHNGIIENYKVIKHELELKGCHFISLTDTEVFAQYIAYHINSKSVQDIIKDIFEQFTGKYAVAFLIEGQNTIYTFRSKGSPMVIGVLENGHAIASDFHAIAQHTNRFILMEDYEYAIIQHDQASFYNKNGISVTKEITVRNIQNAVLTKNGFDTFMMKEIHDQPDVIKNLIHNYICDDEISFTNFSGISKFKKIVAVACGTSFYASLFGKYIIEQYTDIPVIVQISSEFHALKQFWDDNTLYIFASQSGETADTISAMEYTIANKKPSSKILSILNYIHSGMAQKSDYVIQCFAGPEVGVASTKNFTAQIIIFYLLAIQYNTKKYNNIILEIKSIPSIMESLLANKVFHSSIRSVSEKIINANKVVYTGCTFLYPIACEGALKLSELSYLIVQPIPSGEFKHGPIAVVDDTTVVISLLHSQNLYHKITSSNEEIKSRNGSVIDISDNSDASISMEIAKNLPHTYPVLMTIAAQLLSYYTAEKLGNDIDKPRNLAKSVTVE